MPLRDAPLIKASPGWTENAKAAPPKAAPSVQAAPGKSALDYLARISGSQQRLRSSSDSSSPRAQAMTSAFKFAPELGGGRETRGGGETWQRIILAAGVELHVAESADPEQKQQTEELIIIAKKIFKQT